MEKLIYKNEENGDEISMNVTELDGEEFIEVIIRLMRAVGYNDKAIEDALNSAEV